MEPQHHWFDLQLLFLYLVLLGALAGGAYALYNSYMAPKGRGKKGPAKKKAVVPAPQDKQAYPAVKPYEEEWIPAHHLKNRSAKTKKSNAGVTSGDEGVTSGGEATSGAESTPDVKGRKAKRGLKKGVAGN